MLRFRAVLLDLDGTLIDTIPLIRWTFVQVFREFGLPWNDGAVLQTIGLPLREIAARYVPDRPEEFVRRYSAIQKEKHRELTKTYPGAVTALETIRSTGCRTAVVTSKRRIPACEGMKITGIDRFIEVTVAAEDVTRAKPDPEPVYKALDLLRAAPGETVYIGDSWYDIQAGRQAGVTTIGVTWGMATREQLAAHAPDLVVDSWDECLAALRKPRP